MPRQYNIRWRQVDEQKLQRAVRNYNAKRRRLINIDPRNEEILPSRITRKELKENIFTRQDFNRAISSLQRFSIRGSEQILNINGTRITKYEYGELKRNIRRINRIREKNLDNLNNEILKSRGEPLNYTVGMSDIRMLEYKPRNINLNNKSPKELRNYLDLIYRQATDNYYHEKNETYKENYLTAFYKEFNGLPSFDLFYERLKSVPSDVFAMVLKTDTEGSIIFIYDEKDRIDRYNAVLGVWNDYINTKGIEIDDIIGD